MKTSGGMTVERWQHNRASRTPTQLFVTDVADDAGNTGANGGTNEGDYNAFFAADGYFNGASVKTDFDQDGDADTADYNRFMDTFFEAPAQGRAAGSVFKMVYLAAGQMYDDTLSGPTDPSTMTLTARARWVGGTRELGCIMDGVGKIPNGCIDPGSVQPPLGIVCILLGTLERCLNCCVYNPGGGDVSWLPCAEVCFGMDWTKPRGSPTPGGGGLYPRPWSPDYSCKELVSQLAWGGWGDHVDGNDKFQHCYTSCRLSQACGRSLAGLLGTLREHVSWMRDDSQLDIEANEKGIYCAGHDCKSSGYLQPNQDCCNHCCSQSYRPRGPAQIY